MLRIGHRGAAGYEPENTLNSFKKALALNCDMVELDVHICKSGELVVIHDDKVDRTTNGRGKILNLTLSQLKPLDAGRGEKIPTLDEVIIFVAKRAKINIELKGKCTAKPVAETIKRFVRKGWSRDDFLVSSFDHKELKDFRKCDSKTNVGALYARLILRPFHTARLLNSYSINIPPPYAKKIFIDNCHKRNIKVFVYTVNDKKQIQKLRSLGVDGIFSDFPDRI